MTETEREKKWQAYLWTQRDSLQETVFYREALQALRLVVHNQRDSAMSHRWSG